MGLFDWFSSWFASNKDTLSRDQQREIERLLSRMRTEMQDNINAASSNTSRKLEQLVQSHSRRIQSDLDDNKSYVNKEMQRMSEELKKLQTQLEKEQTKKTKEKENDKNDQLSNEYKMMLDMMKLLLDQQRTNNSSAGMVSGNPTHLNSFVPCPPQFAHHGPATPGYPYTPGPAYVNPPNYSIYDRPSPTNPAFHETQLPNSSNNVVGSVNSHSSAIPPNYIENNSCSHPSACCDPLLDEKIFKSPKNHETQSGCGLILPDSRDYNKLVTAASIKKNSKDDSFEKMIDDFSQEFSTKSMSNTRGDGNQEKKIADGVKNFFLKDLNKKNYPKRFPKASSSNACVDDWLKNNERFKTDDDGEMSDSSEVSVKTDSSRFSFASATSGRRVFWNKPQNYGKPATNVNSEGENTNKSFGSKNNKKNNYKYTGNQNKYRKMKNEYRNSNSAKKDDASVSTSASSSGKLSQIHYPSQEEARQKNVDIFKPLTRELLFLGKNDDNDWTTHKPKSLNDIYILEKKYKVFRIVEIS